jgi:DNA polymerase II small subunit
MKEYLRDRHLAPTYGRKTEIAPVARDWLVIDEEPHLFHTGHVHCNGRDYYQGILMANSGCFQSQTEYMKSFGIMPTPGYPIIVEPRDGKINSTIIDLNEG